MEWRKSLQEFEADPPSHCWQGIQQDLDQDVPEIRNKLYHYAEPAPEGALANIFEQLDKKEKRPIFFLSRSRAIAAASVAIFLLLSVLYIIQSPDQKPKIGVSIIQSTKHSGSTNYSTITNQNGEQVLISPKLKSLFSNTSKKDDSLIKQWQQKLNRSTFIPSGNNFFDMAEMIELMEENEKH